MLVFIRDAEQQKLIAKKTGEVDFYEIREIVSGLAEFIEQINCSEIKKQRESSDQAIGE